MTEISPIRIIAMTAQQMVKTKRCCFLRFLFCVIWYEIEIASLGRWKGCRKFMQQPYDYLGDKSTLLRRMELAGTDFGSCMVNLI